jgi:hypothetical protein
MRFYTFVFFSLLNFSASSNLLICSCFMINDTFLTFGFFPCSVSVHHLTYFLASCFRAVIFMSTCFFILIISFQLWVSPLILKKTLRDFCQSTFSEGSLKPCLINPIFLVWQLCQCLHVFQTDYPFRLAFSTY